jgi:Asp-tRNA(Asn)/Glu-tRNA(Gln) amidotransferase A subunit family amidase
MNAKRLLILTAAVCLLTIALAVACGSQQGGSSPPPPTAIATAELSGAELLQTRCTECHTLDRVETSHKTEAEWETTVQRMREHGAQLTDAEAQTLVKYLAQQYGP